MIGIERARIEQHRQGIAVIGVSGKFPGAKNYLQFWENLKAGRSSIEEVPGNRWDWRAFWGDPMTGRNKSNSKWGGFLTDVDMFDADFFGLSAKEVERMDPQQRIMLELAWSCFEDAGIPPSLISGGKTGVFLGVFNHDYKELQERQGQLSIEAHHSTGTATALIANRISWYFNLKGPSLPIDTACSSSLNALHSAIQSLDAGECTMALAGGINLLLTPTRHISFSKTGMLSPTGSCKSFDDKADGYVRGEGAGFVLLKPLAQALVDDDPIYGIVKGSAVNHGGKTYSLTYPNPDAQREVIAEAQRAAGVDARTITYVEAHGTGTPKGDPIEIQGLLGAFLADGAEVSNPYCGVGSVKTNIGHLEAAAGIAGVIKVLLSMQHRQLPGLANFEQLNHRISLDASPFFVVTGLKEWDALTDGAGNVLPRRAGVSSFGFGGTNAHVVLEEAPDRAAVEVAEDQPPYYLICLSARTEESLLQKINDLADWLAVPPAVVRLADVCRTLAIGREHFPKRVAMIAKDLSDLRDKLAGMRAGDDGADCFRQEAQRNEEPDLLMQLSGLTTEKLAACPYQDEQNFYTILGSVAGLYVRGINPDWARPWLGSQGRRVPLPAYSFERRPFWMPEADIAEGRLHPLLTANVSGFAGTRFSSIFSGNEPFLKDHIVNGRKVLPAAACLEMVRAAISTAMQGRSPDGVLVLENVIWGQPIFGDAVETEVYTELSPEGGDRVSFRVKMGSTADATDATICSSGSARTVGSFDVDAVDIFSLREKMNRMSWSKDQLYRTLSRMGLQYGPSHQALERLWEGEGESLARMKVPGDQFHPADDYVLHPGLVDAALQAALTSGEVPDRVDPDKYLPFAVDSVEVVRPCVPEMWALITDASGTKREHIPGAIRQVHVTLCDPTGQVCVRMTNLSFRKAGVNDISLLQPVWIDEPAKAAGTKSAYKQHIVFFCPGGDPIPEEWRRQMPETEFIQWAPDGWGAGLFNNGEVYVQSTVSLFETINTLLRTKPRDSILVQVVIAGPAENDIFSGLSGLLRSASRESPYFTGQVIRVDTMERLPRVLLENVLSEGADQIDYRQGKRRVLCWKELTAVARHEYHPWKDGGVYLITGGAGGLGLTFAREIAGKVSHPVIILAGRSPLTGDGKKAIDELRKTGAAVEYRTANAGDRRSLEKLLEDIVNAHSRLDGILHAAGIIRDSLIIHKKKEDMVAVMAPKVLGTTWLDELTRHLPLDLFILFSSVVASEGNAGQADYAAANAYMHEFAGRRNRMVSQGQRRGHTLSIGWPLWREGGMQPPPGVQSIFLSQMKMRLLETAEGIASLYHCLLSGHSSLAVVPKVNAASLHKAAPAGAAARANPGIAPVAGGEPAHSGGDGVSYHEAVHYFRDLLSAIIKRPADRIDPDTAMEQYGIDSIMVMQMTAALEKVFGVLPKTLFFEYQNLHELTEYFLEHHQQKLLEVAAPAGVMPSGGALRLKAELAAAPQPMETGAPDIAIIGVAGRYPGADNLQEFWDNLCQGRDSITEIPHDRWDHRLYFDADKDKEGKSYSKWGGFIRDVDKFDPLFFNISPLEAERMDPQERLFLQCVYEALEDAGYTRASLAARAKDGLGRNVGVYAGVMYEEYQLFGAQEALRGHPVALWGLPSSIANRVSYFLDLHGPSMAVDTMCSSSLTAIHLACESLTRGKCELAIAGGVNVSIHPNKYLFLSQGRFASSKGRCESFGEGGDGYVPGEGVGAVLLKPLARAIEDKDNIYAVIKSTAVNHGGKTNGYTVPNPKAQAAVIASAFREAGIDPRNIGYFEAHGTGTYLGDPIEIAGLSKAIQTYTTDKGFCSIGSVKSNIGHCESAAGIAGLTKVILQMRYRKIVPSLHSQTLNANIDFAASPFYVQQTLSDWQRRTVMRYGEVREHPLCAGISSFGAGGSNAHIILEEYLPSASPAVSTAAIGKGGSGRTLILLSAPDQDRLEQRARQLWSALQPDNQAFWQLTEVQLADIAYTLQAGREQMAIRLLLHVTSLSELEIRLDEFIRGEWSGVDGNGVERAETVLTGRRISLPVYPFRRERYWIETTRTAPSTSGAMPYLHPLVHVNISDLETQRFSTHFTGGEFYLQDHLIRGGRILPAAAGLEMINAAVRRSLPAASGEGPIRLWDIAWSLPVEVDDNGVTLHIELLQEQNGVLRFMVTNGSAEAHQKDIFFSGKAGLFSSAEDMVVPKRPLDELMDACTRGSFDHAAIYDSFEGYGFNYGSSLRGLREVYVGEGVLVARIDASRAAPDFQDQWEWKIGWLEPALQATLLWHIASGKGGGQMFLPVAMQEVVAFQPSGAGAWAVIHGGEDQGTQVRILDIDILDGSGFVILSMKGVKLAASGAEPTPGTLLLSPVWEACSSAAPAVMTWAKRLVVVASSGGASDDDIPGGRAEWLRLRAPDTDSFRGWAGKVMEKVRLMQREKGNVLVQVMSASEGEGCLAAAIGGMLKTAAIENPGFYGQVIRVPANTGQRELAVMAEECSVLYTNRDIRYHNGMREALQWKVVDRQAITGGPKTEGLKTKAVLSAPRVLQWKDKGVYLITGGAGGLGLIFAAHIVSAAKEVTLILTGRSPHGPAIQSKLLQLSHNGATVRYRQLDVTDAKAVHDAIREILVQHGSLNGIIHSAGVLRDNYLIHTTAPEWDAVLAPKVDGAAYLDRATAQVPIDHLILFSSVTGALGNAGQSNYAVANAFMDEYAHYRNALVRAGLRRGHTVSINWPLWQEGGMHVSKEVEEYLFNSMGMKALATSAGLDAFHDILRSGLGQAMVIQGSREDILHKISSKSSPVQDYGGAREDGFTGEMEEMAIDRLKKLFLDVMKLPPEKIRPDAIVEEYGLDSVLIMKLTGRLEKMFGPVSKTLFFEYRTVRELARYLLSHHSAAFPKATPETPGASVTAVAATAASVAAAPASVPSAPAVTGSSLDIAIVGISGRYPGASDLEEFWQNLCQGKDCITEIPGDRWDYRLYYDANRQATGKSYGKWGGFLRGVDEFDPLFFNISPHEAELLDPQERLFLQCAHETLEDAGYNKQALGGEQQDMPAAIGVYVGVMYSEYQLFGVEESLQGRNVALFGNPSSIANRVSYFYNFSGPSMAIDTMCSSSLTAIHLACRSIAGGECTAAIAGGVNLSIHPNKYLLLSQGKFISGKGRCESFGAGGDGYVPSEGVGAVFLKTLARAMADGDHIYGVIKATAINHGGKANGFTVPNVRAQAAVISAAYLQAGIDPRTISYVEAHGTGTSLGDPIEMKGLENAFRAWTDEKQFCAIGSVKSNIGHSESAAGIAGLTKLILQLRHRQLAPSLHAQALNPNIDFDNSPFVLQRALSDWKRPLVPAGGRHQEYARRAGLSSFGAGGANAHLIIEEYEERAADEAVVDDGEPVIIVLSAKNSERLHAVAQRLVVFLGGGENINLRDLAFTLQAGREALESRMALIVGSVPELRDRLQRFVSGEAAIEGLYLGRIDRDNPVINAFETDEELQEALAKWMGRKKYRKIAEFWVRGLHVDWNRLHAAARAQGVRLRRLSLPTYPFEKERCWAPRGGYPVPQAAAADRQVVTMLLQPYWKPRSGKTRDTGPSAASHYILLAGAFLQEGHVDILRRQWPGVGIIPLQGDADAAGDGFPYLSGQLFRFVRGLLLEKTTGNTRVQLVTSASQPVMSALLAILRTASQENPRLAGELIEIDESLPPEKLLGVLQKQIHESAGVRCRYNDIVFEQAWRKMAVIGDGVNAVGTVGSVPDASAVWKEDGVYLITGGAGGIGLIFAGEIGRRCPGARIILSGRSAVDDKLPLLSSMRQRGIKIEYVQADIADVSSTKLLIERILESFGSLTGIIHSAGVIRDSHLIRKTDKEWLAVMAPKVNGLLHLDELTRDIALDFFVLFSSIAGVFGNPGQSDYATANAFMDEYAGRRNKLVAAGARSGRTVSINWPLWKEAGMGVGPEIAEELERKHGWIPLPTEPALTAFYYAVGYGCDQVMVLHGYEDLIERSANPQSAAVAAVRPAVPAQPVVQGGARSMAPMSPQPGGSQSAGSLRDATLMRLKNLFGEVVKLPASRIDEKEEFQAYGLNSVMIVRLNQLLEQIFGELSKTLFYEYPNLSLMTDHLVKEKEEGCRHWAGMMAGSVAADTTPTPTLSLSSRQPDEPIAIIGLSGRYPQSPTLASFWQNLRDGRDCITVIPADRWEMSGFFEPDKERAVETGKSYSKWGGFLEDFAGFDPLFFNISPREAHSMDPQERLFLQTAWAVLEDAGYTRQQLSERFKGNVGVFAGVTKTGFELYGPVLAASGKDGFLRTSFSSVANRVSYHLNLTGPSMAIDTMCSSSLTAIHEACEHLLRGTCSMAIAGGVNLYLHPQTYIGLCSQSFLAADGKCRSFGEGGSGFVPGEGVGAVLLKRLSAAIADGDHIHAVIRGTGVNHGGRTSGYTVPNPMAQAALIRDALDKAGLNARDIRYVEAHGTGTFLGDPIEITGLSKAFRADTPDKQFCAIGSVKSNIGHLEAAAGIAGLTKMILQMRNGMLVPSLHAAALNPNINFEGSPFYIQNELWSGKTGMACLSSFGAGGSNGHLILEEFSRSPSEDRQEGAEGPAIVVLSARHADVLRQSAKQLLGFIASGAGGSGKYLLHNIAYTLQIGREAMEERLAIVAHSIEMLQECLGAYLEGGPADAAVMTGSVSDPYAQGSALYNGAHELAAAWIKGAEVDWERWHAVKAAFRPVRISLPTYPFRQTKYWLPDTLREAGNQPSAGQEKQWLFTMETEAIEPLREDTDWRQRLQEQLSRRICIVHGNDVEPGPLRELLMQLARAGHLKAPSIHILYADRIDVEAIRQLRPEVILFLGPGLPSDATTAYAAQDIHPVYKLSSTLMQAAWDDPIQLYYQFLTDDANVRPDCRALTGFFRSAMKENDQHIWRSVRMHALTDPAARYQLLVKEWLSEMAGPECRKEFSEIFYEGETRHVCRLVETGLSSDPRPVFRRQRNYVIAGGMGYVGGALLRQLAASCQPNLAILSRTGPDDSRIKECRELEKAGATVRYYTVDITDRTALEAVFRQIREEWGGVHGVINLARAHDSRGIVTKSWESFHSVSRVKILGTCYLDELTAHDDLDFFLLFASVGAYGARGDSDYAYSAAYQNEFARLRHRKVQEGKRKGATVSLCWGPWEVDRLFPESRMKMGALGLDLINMVSAFPRIEAACHGQRPVLGLCAVLDAAKAKEVLGVVQPAETVRPTQAAPLSREEQLRQVIASWEQQYRHGGQITMPEIRRAISMEEMERMDPALVERLYSLLFEANGLSGEKGNGNRAAKDEDQHGTNILAVLRESASEILQVPDIRDNMALQEYGLDSILAMRLSVNLSRKLKCEVPPKYLLEFPTLAELANHLKN